MKAAAVQVEDQADEGGGGSPGRGAGESRGDGSGGWEGGAGGPGRGFIGLLGRRGLAQVRFWRLGRGEVRRGDGEGWKGARGRCSLGGARRQATRCSGGEKAPPVLAPVAPVLRAIRVKKRLAIVSLDFFSTKCSQTPYISGVYRLMCANAMFAPPERASMRILNAGPAVRLSP